MEDSFLSNIMPKKLIFIFYWYFLPIQHQTWVIVHFVGVAEMHFGPFMVLFKHTCNLRSMRCMCFDEQHIKISPTYSEKSTPGLMFLTMLLILISKRVIDKILPWGTLLYSSFTPERERFPPVLLNSDLLESFGWRVAFCLLTRGFDDLSWFHMVSYAFSKSK